LKGARPVWGKEVEKGPARHLVGFPSYIFAMWLKHESYDTAKFLAARQAHGKLAA
jgi:hypothetical protein